MRPKALESLRAAIVAYPSLLVELVKSLGVHEEEEWRGVLRHAHFCAAVETAPPVVERIASIYCKRHLELWQTDAATRFLKVSLKSVTGKSSVGVLRMNGLCLWGSGCNHCV